MTREEFEVWKNYNDRKMLQEWIDAEKAGLQSKKTTAAMCQLFFKAPQSFYDDYLGIATIIVDGVEQRIKTSIATECKKAWNTTSNEFSPTRFLLQHQRDMGRAHIPISRRTKPVLRRNFKTPNSESQKNIVSTNF